MKYNWIRKKLSDVCLFEGGAQPAKSAFSKIEKEGYIRLIQIRDYKSDDNVVYIPLCKARRFCNKDDIMIGRYGPPVFQILKGLSGAYNVALMKAIPDETILSKDYLFYFLKYSPIQEYIISLSSRAAGQSGINKKALYDYYIDIPPLSEQKEIVDKLNDIIDNIEIVKENLEKNLNNTKEFFQSYIHSFLANPDETWETKLLGECFRLQSGDALTSRMMNQEGKYPVYGGNGIAGMHDNFNLAGPNIIIGRVGALCGNARFINEKIWLTDNAFKVVHFNYKFDPSFLNYLLNYINLRSFARQAAQPVISNSSLCKIELKFPKEIEKQEAISEKLDKLYKESQKLSSIYQQKMNNLDELMKSILSKTFKGELSSLKEIEAA